MCLIWESLEPTSMLSLGDSNITERWLDAEHVPRWTLSGRRYIQHEALLRPGTKDPKSLGIKKIKDGDHFSNRKVVAINVDGHSSG